MPPRDSNAADRVENTLDAIHASLDSLQSGPVESRSSTPRTSGYQLDLPAQAAQIDAAASSQKLPPPAPTPPLKRPRGRLVIGTILMAVFGGVAFLLWDGLTRYAAYGIVEAERTPVRAPVAGVVQQVSVAEGDVVRAGDLLCVIENLELTHRAERCSDQLHEAEAELHARIARLRRDAFERQWESLDDAARFFQIAADLRKHQSEAARLQSELERALAAQKFNGVTQHDIDELRHALDGERGYLEMLTAAASRLQSRSELKTDQRLNVGNPDSHRVQPENAAVVDADHGRTGREPGESPLNAIVAPLRSGAGQDSQHLDLVEIEPLAVRIENLQREQHRCLTELHATRVVAPVAGRVLKHQCHSGLRVAEAEELLEIIEDGTTAPVIYLSQEQTSELNMDKEIVIHIEPEGRGLPCRVGTIGHAYQPPPDSISRYYTANEPVLPVELTPPVGVQLRPGAIVRVPFRLESLLSGM